MREIRLYDTKTASVRPLEPREPGKVGIYACGPTVYARVHVGNARPFVVFSQLKRFLEHEGLEATLVANITDINDKIYDAARGPRARPSAELAARDDRALHRRTRAGSGSGGRTTSRWPPRASTAIIDLISALVDGGHAYEAGGDVYFRVRSLDGYGELSRRDVDQMDQGEGVEGADRKEDPLDFALWKATKEGEDTTLGLALGPGPPRLAHRVLRDGRAVPGRGLRHPRRRDRPRLPAPRERGGADAGRARQAARARVDAQRDAAARPTRRCPSRWATSAGSATCSTRSAARCSSCTSPAATTASRSRSPTSGWRRRGARRRGSARPGGACAPGDSPEELAPLRDAFFDALADDFNTARALAALYDWIREANRREGAVGGAHLREMLDVLGLATLLDAGDGPPAGGASSWPSAASAARDARDWAEADRLRDELRAMGWEVRDGPQGPELVPAG